MKKMIKLSLVAAVAVAGLTTSASAAALEDSIKNTDLAGYLRLRLNTTHSQASEDTLSTHEQKAVLNFKTKVNDTVTSNIKLVAAGNTKGDTLNLNQANFIVAGGAYTAIVGKQTAQSPFVANNGDTVATGLTVLVPAGPVTIAAAHYNDATSATTGTTAATPKVSALGAIANIGPVNVELWGAQTTTTDHASILASANVGPVTVSAHHAEKDTDNVTDEVENSQLVVSGKAGVATLFAAYATTGKNGGDTTIDGDTDGRLIYALETINTKTADVDAVVVGVSAPVGPVTLGLTYLDADIGTGKGDETKLSVSYAMSKNFNISAWYSAADVNSVDTDKSRLEMKYSF